MIASIGGSSSLSQVSMAEMRQRMFSKIDTNSDGKHDKNELAQMVAQGPQGGPSVDDILSKFDTDGDGSISESEFNAGPEKGQQAQGGFPPPPPPAGMGNMSSADFLQQMFNSADTNGDKKIDKDEMAEVVAKQPQGGPSVDDIFSKLDTDEDGSISESEFKAGDKADQQVQQAGDAEDKLLKALLEAMEKEKQATSGTGHDGSQSSNTATTISEMLSTALKTYMQSSFNGFSQAGAQSFLGSDLYA
jgi:Ca2+-binding EF-hand superfamily protein